MKIEIFDPPMCCPTGVCGPSVDSTLLEIHEAVLALKKDGTDIERYSLSHQMNQFMNNSIVAELLNNQGLEVLPITLVNGQVFKTKAYPSYQELKSATAN